MRLFRVLLTVLGLAVSLGGLALRWGPAYLPPEDQLAVNAVVADALVALTGDPAFAEFRLYRRVEEEERFARQAPQAGLPQFRAVTDETGEAPAPGAKFVRVGQ